MRRFLMAGLMAALLAVPLAGEASALPIAKFSPLSGPDLTTVQFRQHRGTIRHGFAGRRFEGRPRYYGDRGVGIGAGLAGLAAGAIIAGAIGSAQADYGPPPVEGDAEAYCASRFRSYDPASGTYMGYDGQRHSCP